MTKYINKAGEVLTITQDDFSPDNPLREDDGIVGTYLTWDSRLESPMKTQYNNELDELKSLLGEEAVETALTNNSNRPGLLSDLEEAAKKQEIVLRPLTCYEHSGITYFIGTEDDEWDSNSLGFVYAYIKQARELLGIPADETDKEVTKEIEDCFQAEIQLYNLYINGEVYGFNLDDKDGNDLDSCSGFYGVDLEHDLNEADKAGLLEAVNDCSTGSGRFAKDWQPAIIERVVYRPWQEQ